MLPPRQPRPASSGLQGPQEALAGFTYVPPPSESNIPDCAASQNGLFPSFRPLPGLPAPLLLQLASSSPPTTGEHLSPLGRGSASYWAGESWCSVIPVVCVVRLLLTPLMVVVCLSLRIVGQSMGVT